MFLGCSSYGHDWKEVNFSNKYTMVVSVTWGTFYEVCSKCYQVRQWRDAGWGAGGRHYSLGHQSVRNLIEKVESARVEHRDMKPYKKYILQLLKQAVPQERKRFQEKVNKFVLDNTG